ncbi:hypothetical protein G6F35_013690 [Rhizopus arrhizus]|nr:hypothetical protein G6F35_013690 [Rhizopus arrhizus]
MADAPDRRRRQPGRPRSLACRLRCLEAPRPAPRRRGAANGSRADATGRIARRCRRTDHTFACRPEGRLGRRQTAPHPARGGRPGAGGGTGHAAGRVSAFLSVVLSVGGYAQRRRPMADPCAGRPEPRDPGAGHGGQPAFRPAAPRSGIGTRRYPG